MRLSDWLGTAGVWFHIDSEHHVMALVDVGYAHFHHLAFDVVDIGKMRDLLDHLARHGRWVSWGPTRHGIAGNIATYVRITEEPCHVELYCDMERLADDHVPRTYPDDRYSSNTWGPLPPRSYFRFDPVAVEWERESWETRGRPLPPAAGGRGVSASRVHRPAHARGALVARPVPAVALRRGVPGDRLLGGSREGRRLPAGGHRAASRPGRCAFVAADWQSCSEGGDELVDPSRSQYKEVFVVVNGLLDGEEVTVCSYIWVDRDFALTRGWIQGFPKKLGSIWITRSFGLGGPADPGMEPGARFGATCAAYERRVAEATVTLEHAVGRRAVPQRARRSSTSATSRGSQPASTTTRPCTSSSAPCRATGSVSEVWEGSATLELFGARARGGRRARAGADRPRLPLHVRLHRRRPRDRDGSSAVP